MSGNDLERPVKGDTWEIAGLAAVAADLRKIYKVQALPVKVQDWPHWRQVVAVGVNHVAWRQFNADASPTGVAVVQTIDRAKGVRRFEAIADEY
jgi:hypothetical protein